jgi:hypothetical protein
MEEKRFRLLSLPDLPEAIYQVIGTDELSILIRWKKSFRLDMAYGSSHYVFLPAEKQSYLHKKGKYRAFGNKKTFLDAFGPEEQVAIRRYLKSNHVKLKKADDRSLKDLLTYCGSLSRNVSRTATNAAIRGRITDEESGEPVIGATMFLEETRSGTASDGNGYLSMVVKPGNYTAVFEYMGMEKITTKNIKEIPMLIGERDILKVSEMLPGIVTVGEGSAGEPEKVLRPGQRQPCRGQPGHRRAAEKGNQLIPRQWPLPFQRLDPWSDQGPGHPGEFGGLQ